MRNSFSDNMTFFHSSGFVMLGNVLLGFAWVLWGNVLVVACAQVFADAVLESDLFFIRCSKR